MLIGKLRFGKFITYPKAAPIKRGIVPLMAMRQLARKQLFKQNAIINRGNWRGINRKGV